ncbi:hypothetical protein SERLADRAFT_392238 [Serpula lacrymans var. lacrymans S7.9]|nr:uncharacterized protein SERLADRAFT_392238 [Serpula lacrymans var. lacrymans S7.9]EGO23787.1 hypothetical protein SERLADRAFT_392238 [Serpula lacrymans var. lacrymans S7.9]
MFTPKAAVGSPLAIKNQNLAQAEGDNMKLREINSFMLTNRKGGKDSEEMVVSRKDYEECHQSIRDLRKGNVWLGGRVQRLDESYQRSEVAMRELRKMVGQSEEANRELRKVAGQSEERYIKSEKRWEERHARSEEAIRELRKTNQRLDESNLELKKTLRDVRAEVIEERASREKSEQEIRRYLRLITPLHLRALLDKARQKILMDVEGGTSWESYRRGRDVDTFSKDILEELSVKYHPPSSEAVHFLCYASKEIRKRGNEAAHKADVSDIRKALMDEQLDAGDVGDHERLLLKELFEFAYGQAI